MDNVYEALKVELERIKVNLIKSHHGGPVQMPSSYGNEIQAMGDQMISCEEKLIQVMRDKMCTMRNLITMTNEIILLSQQRG